ncbi:MAG: translational GTPase TypA [Gloeobacteraceae cyanobacterium ES-bin-144]|nr:translational GTPase TypA [Verrucomicrobiales bacterium]
MSLKIRNLAIIAHVDHGKTTLVDQLLQAGGTYRDNQATTERAMDSMDLEREKGITIKAKNTAILWNGYTINIVDTPGHADFGAEVERVMKMVDGVLLVVDASGGPQAQTRFVLRKAMQEGLKPIVVINKIDRPLADPLKVHDQVLELFLDLDADEEQFNAPFCYGSARDGYFMNHPDDERKDCIPLLEKIVKFIPEPKADPEAPFHMLVSNIEWDDYVGRVAIGKVLGGSVTKGDTIWLLRKDGTKQQSKVMKTFTYSGLATADSEGCGAGGIVGIAAGIENIDIGETLTANNEMEALPFVAIDPPTVSMQFSINDGPLAGKEGKHVTSRAIRDRLMRELKTNISITVEDTDLSGVFNVSARGAMQIAVLVEQMRREGFEVLVSRPVVIFRRDDAGKLLEPFETLYVEAPGDYTQGILKILMNRKGMMEHMDTEPSGRTFIQAVIPTRGLLGFETELVNLTSGHGIMSHLFKEYGPHAGEIQNRTTGTLVSMDSGTATPYSLQMLEERGVLFVAPGDAVYGGMLVGENPRVGDLPVNPVKEKHLDNMRSSGKDKTSKLTPPVRFSLERAIEYIDTDELVEATPLNIRLRKRVLDANARKRSQKGATVEDRSNRG